MAQTVIREFKLTTFSLKNKNTVYLILMIIMAFGYFAYVFLPKELFPDVNMPTVFIQTTYFGNPPEDIENLVTRPIEKEVKSIKGLSELRSTSAQDASLIFVEFNSNVDIDKALQDTKDAVDKAKSNLPTDLTYDPVVMDFDFSEFPIININLSGDYSILELKKYAEFLEDEFETIPEVSKAEIKGTDEREIEINVDLHKMESLMVSFTDIERAIQSENLSMSGGELKLGETRRSIRAIGEYKNMKEIENTIIKSEQGNIVYLKDVATVKDGFAEPKSFARLDNKPVVSVQVIKKSGENLLNATNQVFEIIKKARESDMLPEGVKINYTNDQSKNIREQLHNLENSMIMGFIFVVLVLFFFMGLRNAVFVGLAIPMSMFLSFLIFGIMGKTINMVVLFSLILALGMLVDNAIVVVENIYRFIDNGETPFNAAKYAVGEIAMPIISSTATTLAAFFPLIFWGGMIGEFMKILPVTLIIVLTSSLFVALIINPVIVASFIKRENGAKELNRKKSWIGIISLIVIGGSMLLLKNFSLGNFILIFAILGIVNVLFLHNWAKRFQNSFLPWLENFYLRFITFSLKGHRPFSFFIGTFLLLIFTIAFFVASSPETVFFPNSEPQFINIIAEMPIGTDITTTDKRMKEYEAKAFEVLKEYEKITESVQTIVGQGVAPQNTFTVGNTPYKGMMTIKFVDFKYREGILTTQIMKKLSDVFINKYPGVSFTIEKNQNGPPTGSPINLEIQGKDIDKLVEICNSVKKTINKNGINGIEGLKLDIDAGKPELILNINRENTRRFGISTGQIASTIRTALFGKEISKFKEGEDDFPIQLRLKPQYRYSLSSLLNQKITYRNNRGQLRQVPISAVADVEYSSSYGTIRRKDMKRVVTLFSNVTEGYNANHINEQLKAVMSGYNMPEGYTYSFTGEQEEQAETMIFLVNALLIAISLILIILVSQFNSFAKPLIIISSVILSTIGVFGGLSIFKMDVVVIMTGVGIISLAGVVVNNAIVLIDYIDYLKLKRKEKLGMDLEKNLPIDEIVQCIINGGKVRLRPVLLTAITTILGLIPMAVGMNIDFEGLISSYSPDIYFGGDNAAFWGPMAWTVIFGLTFATFLTLVIVPVMYLFANKAKIMYDETFKKKIKNISLRRL